MTAEQLAGKIKAILENKKALDIETIEIAQKTILADYFVIASGTGRDLGILGRAEGF